MCSACSRSGVLGSHTELSERSGWPGHCLLTVGLADQKDLFQPEQFYDSGTLLEQRPCVRSLSPALWWVSWTSRTCLSLAVTFGGQPVSEAGLAQEQPWEWAAQALELSTRL